MFHLRTKNVIRNKSDRHTLLMIFASISSKNRFVSCFFFRIDSLSEAEASSNGWRQNKDEKLIKNLDIKNIRPSI